MSEMKAHTFDEILLFIKQHRGIDLSGYRRSTIRRRIESIMIKWQMDDAGKLLDLLRSSPAKCDLLLDAIAINVSCFFRNPVVFEILAQSIIPEIINRKRNAGSREIRVWSAGCSAGEEAYSIAILLDQAVKKQEPDWAFHIFGTDIDGKALTQANVAKYSKKSLENVKLGFVTEYFSEKEGEFELDSLIRSIVNFSCDNLISTETVAPPDSIFGSFDLVLCRNLLIYFSQGLQNSALEKLCCSLASGGYLVLGETEFLNSALESRLRTVDIKNKIYQNRF